MDSLACNNLQPVVRKAKKKPPKGKVDRLKQAEKKKRRLEKALATSAAIRSELEKKKQNKREEQQRLDEEGAAIAEAVALQVLLGEDSDDSCHQILLNKGLFNPWDFAGKRGSFLPQRIANSYCVGSNADNGSWSSFLYGFSGKNARGSYFEDAAGLIAAQAVSSLRIREDDTFDALHLWTGHCRDDERTSLQLTLEGLESRSIFRPSE